jgi:hypothetical protein
MSATLRFRWSVLFAAASVGALWAAAVGLLSYYDGERDQHGQPIIEGPEFFGAVFLLGGFTIFAAIVLLFGGMIALVSRDALAAENEVERS